MGDLTAIELRVMELICEGSTEHHVAHRLLMSPDTVRWHLENIYRKTRVRGRRALALWAVRPGTSGSDGGAQDVGAEESCVEVLEARDET